MSPEFSLIADFRRIFPAILNLASSDAAVPFQIYASWWHVSCASKDLADSGDFAPFLFGWFCGCSPSTILWSYCFCSDFFAKVFLFYPRSLSILMDPSLLVEDWAYLRRRCLWMRIRMRWLELRKNWVVVYWVESLGKNLFIFHMVHEEDRVRIMKQGPWFFDKFLLVLELPVRAQKLYDYSFNFVTFWLHFFDLSLDWYNVEMAPRLGNAIGDFKDVDSINGFHFWGASLRVKVRIDISRTLRRGVKINLEGPMNGSWVPIRYERLREFCSFCRIIGHHFKDCGQFYKQAQEICFGS